VAAGDWQQRQLWNGDYVLSDLMDWHEMQSVKIENSRRADEAARLRREGEAR
jgi:hypothetical protein